MVTVLGFNVPLFEILLVFVVFLTAGLIFILLELRRLNQYLAIERSDLQRFEQDIGLFEQEERRLAQEEGLIGQRQQAVQQQFRQQQYVAYRR